MSSLKVIENAKVVHERGIIWDGVIVIDGDRIVNYGKRINVEIPIGAEHIDAKGAYVGPGFVDIHCHAGGGYSTHRNPEEASAFFLEHGTTTLLATPSYGLNADEFVEAIKSVKSAMGKAKTIRGLYLEGPYTNPDYGSHAYCNPWRKPIDPADFTRIVDEAGSLAKVWTIAPELEGIRPFLEYARKVNPQTIFALGHSEALPSEIRALGKYRPTIQTHSMNATGRVGERKGGLRYFGPDEYCFQTTEMYAELISDSLCIHVNTEMQSLLLHTKGLDKVILITDSTVYNNPTPEKYAGVTDLNFDDNGGIAGSKITMEQACRNIMTHTNCGIAQAFIMASRNPARAIGFDAEVGSIEVGKRADLVFVDDMFNIKEVMLGGNMC